MSKSVSTPANLGTKRQCPKCAAKFYDFGATPVVCPKCKHSWKPEVAKPGRAKAKKPAEAVKPVKKRPMDEESRLLDALDLPDAGDDAEGGAITELETLEDAMEDVESLDEVEEHQDDDDSNAESDDADDDMFMEEMAGEVLVDTLDDLEEDEDDEDEDDEDEDEDDEDDK
jgi:uncharacterized protein (TIGR02300 family)